MVKMLPCWLQDCQGRAASRRVRLRQPAESYGLSRSVRRPQAQATTLKRACPRAAGRAGHRKEGPKLSLLRYPISAWDQRPSCINASARHQFRFVHSNKAFTSYVFCASPSYCSSRCPASSLQSGLGQCCAHRVARPPLHVAASRRRGSNPPPPQSHFACE